MDASPAGPDTVRLGDADHALLRPTVSMNGGWQIVSIPVVVSPVEAGLARQQALADQLTSASVAPSLLVW